MLETIVNSILLPPGIILAPSAFLFLSMPFFRRKFFILFLLFIGMGILYILSTAQGANWLVARVQKQPVLVIMGPNKSDLAQAIVVLGEPNIIPPEYGMEGVNSGVLERLRFAARAARMTNKPLLLSGGLTGGKITEAQTMQIALQQEFGFTQEMWLENGSTNLKTKAENSAKMLKGRNVHSIILVTDSLSMQRAVNEFTKQALTVVAAPIGTITWDAQQLKSWAAWLPGYKNLFYSSLVLQEYINRVLSLVRS